jgi:3-phosphoshikimate 1-carboxyvinyltransferase
MNIKVTPAEKLAGEVRAPSSKSYTIRAITAAMLAEGTSLIRDPLFSEDTKACIHVSETLGARIERADDGLSISGVVGFPQCGGRVLNTLNSGTTIRLMTAIASLCHEKVILTGDESIQKRPIEPLLAALRQLHVKCASTNGCPPLWVQGPLHGGSCEIPGDISSQFISALLMALPCAKENSDVTIIGRIKSRPYIDMTLEILERFRIQITPKTASNLFIPGDQVYKATTYQVEGDYSSGAFILAAAALTNSKITVSNLFRSSKQADKKFLSILKLMGANVDAREEQVIVSGTGPLSGVDVDLSDSPDLLPILAVAGALARGKTRIYNVAHARLKECDRIKAMYTELSKMGASIVEKPDGLEITGGRLKGAQVDGWKDHRIVMALAIAGLKADGMTEITGREYVGVTFPGFVRTMRMLGANMR